MHFICARRCTKGLYVFYPPSGPRSGFCFSISQRKNQGSGKPTKIPQCWGLRFENSAITPFTMCQSSLRLFLLLDLCCFLQDLFPLTTPIFSGVGRLSIWIRVREQVVFNPLFIDVFLKVYPFLLSCLHNAWLRFSVCLVLAFALHACRNVWSRRSLSVGCVVALWHLATELWSSSGRLRAQRLLAMAAVKMYVEVKWKSQSFCDEMG